MSDVRDLLEPIRRIHERVRDAVVSASERTHVDQLAAISDDESEGDTIYAVDRVSEELLVQLFAEELAQTAPLVLIAEGIEDGKLVLPVGAAESDAVWRVIVDPIDGTRGLMYQKRSAWVLTGVAPNRGAETSLLDIELAVQTEIPLVKQHLCDVLWAIRGEGAQAERFNRLTQQRQPLPLRPSRAAS
ncbi:MAG TPA: inositol monophosphatase family protein, partial [Pyrinomonadaceae bacterium]|nr:inositol monophosphatase family protein [Pyrinomonadaceae bacterium]